MKETIGILGLGQLALMLAKAAQAMEYEVCFYGPTLSSHLLGDYGNILLGDYTDLILLNQFAEKTSLVTYEIENIPLFAAAHIHKSRPLYPSIMALMSSQDRITEKSLFQSIEIPTTQYYGVTSDEELIDAYEKLGPGFLKTTTLGYDGHGQVFVQSMEDIELAWQKLGGSPLIYERAIKFQRELSLICVRSQNGEVKFYPLVENHHDNGILSVSIAPAPNIEQLQGQAETYALKILEKLNYVGILTIEFFQVGDGLVANEIAPRVHNSGHWTIEGAEVSQFENHLRAILGLPLGDTAPKGHSMMINCLGEFPSVANPPEWLYIHDYGKIKNGDNRRKMGHLTIIGDSPEQVRNRIKCLLVTF